MITNDKGIVELKHRILREICRLAWNDELTHENCEPDDPAAAEVKAECRDAPGSYKNVRVVDGFTLVPHLSEYFLDNLHPNSLGAEVYGRNLVEAIRRIGF